MDMQTITGSEVIGVNTGLLTPRQLEATVWAAEGKDNDSIGKIMGCSAETAKRHLMAAMHKLNVDNRTHLVTRAFMRGVLTARLLALALCAIICLGSAYSTEQALRTPRPVTIRIPQSLATCIA